MLNNLIKLFKDESNLTHTAGILSNLANIMTNLDVQYLKNGQESKNEAIDLICQLLQKQKDCQSSFEKDEEKVEIEKSSNKPEQLNAKPKNYLPMPSLK